MCVYMAASLRVFRRVRDLFAKLAIARVEVSPKHRIKLGWNGGDGGPVSRCQKLNGAWDHLLFFRPPGGTGSTPRRLRRPLPASSARLRPGKDFIETVEKPLAGRGNHDVLLHAARDFQLQPRIALDESSERHIFAKVVEAVGIVAQVVDDQTHQLIVGALVGMKSIDLLLDQIEKSRQVAVVGVPSDKRIGQRVVRARGFSAAVFDH